MWDNHLSVQPEYPVLQRGAALGDSLLCSCSLHSSACQPLLPVLTVPYSWVCFAEQSILFYLHYLEIHPDTLNMQSPKVTEHRNDLYFNVLPGEVDGTMEKYLEVLVSSC